MAIFNEAVWVSRAVHQFQNSPRDVHRATTFVQALESIVAIKRLIRWLKARDISVKFVKSKLGEYDHNKLVISVSESANPELQLHVLLHECGHHLLELDYIHEKVVRPALVGPAAWIVKKTNAVTEEVEAWARGGELAKRLKLHINEAGWDTNRTNCLKTYMSKALRVGEYALTRKKRKSDGIR